MTLQPVILCGGSGTRLWPSSREQSPKQLLAFGSRHSMLQATALRIAAGAGAPGSRAAAPIVVANEQYRFITAEQLREIDVAAQSIVLEPMGRNTAPALTVAALIAQTDQLDPALLVMPADHVIVDEGAFRTAISMAMPLAMEGRIVTFGIVPTSAETGYGYIEAGAAIGETAYDIAAFAEKPDRSRAEAYLASGRYYWNSGIFLLKASVWLQAVGKLQPAMLAACRAAVEQGQLDRDFLRLDRASFEACPADSIDYAVMEHLPPGEGAMVPLSAGWSDVGSWGALLDVLERDERGNSLTGDVIAVDTSDSLVRAESRLVATVGVSNTIVIETPDAVLVASRDQLQQVKQVVARLKSLGRSESDAHRKIYRPWGYYDSIDQGDRFQVKRIVVNPLAQLSLQMHHHRAEHWIVVRGTARVTRGEETFLLAENQSTYIPLGIKHRLENPGKVPLEMIEVQSGSYLGEDDIVRFDDTYGRT
jgi:mannose-1-phosphate guanylyltransferase/mannose-6-phosphate isomerase